MSTESHAEYIQFKCEKCSAEQRVPAAQAGTLTACSHCQAPIQVPAQSTSAQVAAIRTETISAADIVAAPAVMQIPALPASVPLPVSVETLSVNAPSLGMGETIDPMSPNAAPAAPASASFQPAPVPAAGLNSPPPSSAVSRPAVSAWSPAPPRNRGARTGIIAAGILICFGVAAAIGISVQNGVERARIEKEVDDKVAAAGAAFVLNDIKAAASRAEEAQKMISASPQPLDEQKLQRWKPRVAQYIEIRRRDEELKSIFANAEKDLAGVRTKLENQKNLLGPASDANRPLVREVETLLDDVGKLELKRKKEKLSTEIDAAEKTYHGGKIIQAGEVASEIAQKMAEKPRVEDLGLEKRLAVLRKRADTLLAARKIRMAAKSDNYEDAKAKLQGEVEKIDQDNPDLKPLAESIATLKDELVQEEKRNRKLSADEEKQLTDLAVALAHRDSVIESGAIQGDTIGLKYNGKPLRFGIQRTLLSVNLFLEAGENRYIIEPRDLDRREHRVFELVLEAAEAMKKAGVRSDEMWSVMDEAPFVSARRTTIDGKEYVFLRDRLYTGRTQQKPTARKEAEDFFAAKAEALKLAVEKDSKTPDDVRRVIGVAIGATYKEADWNDHLPGEFVRKVINDNYIESYMPGSDERLKKELADYREAYARVSTAIPSFRGASADGSEIEELRNYEKHAVWRLYDKAADVTTFAVINPDDERDCLFILYDFPGKLQDYPEGRQPKTIRMTHEVAGVTITYDNVAQKMSVDDKAWLRSVDLESVLMPDEYRDMKGYGPPGWCLPPHVLIVDLHGVTRSIITPFGKLDAQDFNAIPAGEERNKAMEAFLDKMSKVMPTTPYMHLYFRYFFEYVLDSPITSLPWLLGSRAHSGDVHQTAYQSLQRYTGGRYLGDCDDLAEFFMNVTRRQNKLSFVMSLPQHAACGWLEKNPAGEGCTFYVLDTGPPRIFKNNDMDKAIEAANRAYDDDKTMRFDPKSLGYLFRFNGEPTRTPYFLSSRMFVDKAYAEAMERVQSYWHFHFYALGIETMTKMIEDGDRVPENCIELAGLYGQVREVEDSTHWTHEALKQFGPEEKLSRMSEQFRIGMMWQGEHDKQKAYDTLKPMIDELKDLENDPQSNNFISMRLQVMGLLVTLDRPWQAWDVVAKDLYMFAEARALKMEHVGGVTSAYLKMQDLVKKGKVVTAVEKDSTKSLERLLKFFYTRALFDKDDDFNDYMRKYAYLGIYYAAKMGREKFEAELLKGGPFPDPSVHRNHEQREKSNLDEDWKWIRLSLSSYGLAIGDALDMDEPPEKWRKDDAVKLSDAMFKAADEARKFGSLASAEFQLLSTRIFRDFLVKDWADLEMVLAEVEKKDWARLTSDVAETFGRSARFVTPEEFAQQYRVFTRHIKSRPAYFTVVYEAYRADATAHALAAAKIAVELQPQDEDMKREEKFLGILGKKRAERAVKGNETSKGAGTAEKIVPPPSKPNDAP